MSKNILCILQELKDLPYRKTLLVFILAITGIVMLLIPDVIIAFKSTVIEVAKK